MASSSVPDSAPAEDAPLLGRESRLSLDEHEDATAAAVVVDDAVAPPVARRLYVSHFLSTWNARVFEFGSVLYLGSIFPGTLLPMSLYAFTRGLAALAGASAVGRYIDSGNRLNVVRTSIVYQRLVTVVSCALFYLLAVNGQTWGTGGKYGMVAVLVAMACVEKLCAIMNLVAIEKDWVVVVANNDAPALRRMNAQMRRIDLVCKLLGPLCIALVDGWSTQVAILITLAMNLVSVGLEYFAIAQAYDRVPALQQAKAIRRPDDSQQEAENEAVHSGWHQIHHVFRRTKKDFALYIRHEAFLASFSGSLLYFTVLSFSGQMVTYLLSTGYSPAQIGVARTISVAFEISATWIAPWLMSVIGPVRAGLWFSSLQLNMLIAGLTVFWVFIDQPLLSASGLVGGTILSRVGLWGFDLCTQVIVQEEVEAGSRGAFSAVEAAWQNTFELLCYISTAIFYRPEQFKWPSLLSVVAVAVASVAYAHLVRSRRGHLIHVEKLARLCKDDKDRSRQRHHAVGVQRIASDDRV